MDADRHLHSVRTESGFAMGESTCSAAGSTPWSAQTALLDIIGRMMLADILVGRSAIDEELQRIIDERTTPWGVTVQSVEIRDIVIPQDLEDAMSRQAQAERERQARVILGESEKQIAASFAEASEAYVITPQPCICAP